MEMKEGDISFLAYTTQFRHGDIVEFRKGVIKSWPYKIKHIDSTTYGNIIASPLGWIGYSIHLVTTAPKKVWQKLKGK